METHMDPKNWLRIQIKDRTEIQLVEANLGFCDRVNKNDNELQRKIE